MKKGTKISILFRLTMYIIQTMKSQSSADKQHKILSRFQKRGADGVGIP